jgi:transcriptional regulator with XRE-family HTH domain
MDRIKEIRAMREAAGLTQKGLAMRAGLSRSLIAGYEGGTIPIKDGTFERIAAACRQPRKTPDAYSATFPPKPVSRFRGERMRYMRQSLGLSQEEFALKCGIARPTLNRYEKGKRPVSDSVWVRFQKVFGAAPQSDQVIHSFTAVTEERYNEAVQALCRRFSNAYAHQFMWCAKVLAFELFHKQPQAHNARILWLSSLPMEQRKAEIERSLSEVDMELLRAFATEEDDE